MYQGLFSVTQCRNGKIEKMSFLRHLLFSNFIIFEAYPVLRLCHFEATSAFPTLPGDWVGVDVSRGARRQGRRGQDHLLIKGLQPHQGGKAAFLQIVGKHSHQVRPIPVTDCLST